MATVIYKYGTQYEYRDEEGAFTTEEVRKQLVQYFPELANASSEESTDADGNKVVNFVKKAGTKGATDTLSDADLEKVRQVARIAEAASTRVELPPDIVLKMVAEMAYSREVLYAAEAGR